MSKKVKAFLVGSLLSALLGIIILWTSTHTSSDWRILIGYVLLILGGVSGIVRLINFNESEDERFRRSAVVFFIGVILIPFSPQPDWSSVIYPGYWLLLCGAFVFLVTLFKKLYGRYTLRLSSEEKRYLEAHLGVDEIEHNQAENQAGLDGAQGKEVRERLVKRGYLRQLFRGGADYRITEEGRQVLLPFFKRHKTLIFHLVSWALIIAGWFICRG